ncbi:MAG: hypothetical protein EOO73_19485 [Myxococcales bacterium]|nr:MAG: hypothetical protein EOO73_19485 [Myxococcales bacterium]
MSDPKRLLDGAGSAEVASLLRALPTPRAPTPAEEADLVRRMVAPLANPVAPVSASHAASWWLGALVAIALVGGAWLVMSPGEPPTRGPVARPPAPAAQPPAVTLPAEPAPLVVEPAPSVAPLPPKRGPAPDTLAEEAELLERARRSLASGPGPALTLLRQHETRFPSGQLAAERLFLTVQALERAGDHAGAKRSAESLVRRFPRSVYAAQVRQRYAAPEPRKD